MSKYKLLILKCALTAKDCWKFYFLETMETTNKSEKVDEEKNKKSTRWLSRKNSVPLARVPDNPLHISWSTTVQHFFLSTYTETENKSTENEKKVLTTSTRYIHGKKKYSERLGVGRSKFRKSNQEIETFLFMRSKLFQKKFMRSKLYLWLIFDKFQTCLRDRKGPRGT